MEQVYYYGAGCTSYEKKNVLGASLVAQFKTPIQVESDLLAAAVACSNARPALLVFEEPAQTHVFMMGKSRCKECAGQGGFLGDEGSGAVLGKMFCLMYSKGLAPKRCLNGGFL